MSETTSLSSGEKIVTTSTMMDDPELLGAHPVFPSTYRPFLDELCEKTKFTKSEIRFLYRGFKQECPGGIVQEDTFKEIYQKFFPYGNSTVYAHLVFKAFDITSCGAITFKDMILTLSTLLRGSNREKLKWIFSRLYDLNGNGFITKRELCDIITAIHDLVGVSKQAEDRKTRDHVDRIFSKFDANRDGIVTIEEFLESCLKDDVIVKSLQSFSTTL
ncbi:unnamed protein product [Allacma fusca]|uniref:EF-hand domain-containing protein n=1 Tax=Allacma fusca TaxID=39272 RepID=A0A8J2LAB6_9HEXA|nr:unnamed protein product [Allacma fusca]